MEKGELTHLVVGMQPGAATLKNSMEAPQKIKNKMIISFTNSTTAYLHKAYENTELKRCTHPVFTAAQ